MIKKKTTIALATHFPALMEALADCVIWSDQLYSHVWILKLDLATCGKRNRRITTSSDRVALPSGGTYSSAVTGNFCSGSPSAGEVVANCFPQSPSRSETSATPSSAQNCCRTLTNSDSGATFVSVHVSNVVLWSFQSLWEPLRFLSPNVFSM